MLQHLNACSPSHLINNDKLYLIIIVSKCFVSLLSDEQLVPQVVFVVGMINSYLQISNSIQTPGILSNLFQTSHIMVYHRSDLLP